MWHRPFGDMLIDMFNAVGAGRKAGTLRTQSLELTLPIEVWLKDMHAKNTFVADVPVWRWRTEFDQEPSRLRITFEETEL